MTIKELKYLIHVAHEIILVVPQGSMFGSLSFNIDICDLSFIIDDCDSANYADDDTPYLSGKVVAEVFNSVENMSSNLFQ